jgi:hypothetical protein
MKILSIDVGIKNLAYCILEVSTNTYKIVSWDVINLCGVPLLCNQQTKKGQCNRVAKYQKNQVNCCKSCAKKTNFAIPCEKLMKANKSRTKVSDLRSIVQEYNISVSNNAKKDELQQAIKSYMAASVLEPISKTTASEMSLVDIGIAIRDAFDTPQFLSVDTIIIENQISPIANRMKTIQGMIAQFFIMKQIEDVHFVSASNKLKPYIENKTTYKERKALGISITNKIIQDNIETNIWQEHFSKHNKKDDLADSFLQGLWYVNKHIK